MKLKFKMKGQSDSVVVKPKKKRKPPQINDVDNEGVEEDYSEVMRSKIKRRPPLVGAMISSCCCYSHDKEMVNL